MSRRIKFVESNIPSQVKVVVKYTTRLRNPENSKHLPKWYTLCELVDRETGERLAYAHSNCNEDDQPVRKIGRAIAVGRAYKSLYYSWQAGVQHEV